MPGGDLLWLHGAPWSTFGPVLLIAQVICVVHALRTGRPYWWFWIIIAVPLIGVLAYLFVEIRPTLGKVDLPSLLWRMKSTDERIRLRREILEDSSTVRNRLAVADELRAAHRYDEECEVLAAGLQGPFKDDAMLRMRWAQAVLDAGRPAEAERIVDGTTPERSSDSQYAYALLRARIDDQLGRTSEAEQKFRELIAKQRSEAARFYFAECLMRNQRNDEAAEVLRDILHKYRRGTRVWRYQEREWYFASKRLLPSTTARNRGATSSSLARMLWPVTATLSLVGGGSIAPALAEPPVPVERPAIDYVRQIKPLLRERCYACHGGLKQEAGLRLDTADLARRGADDGPVFVAGMPASGRLLERITATDLDQRMPPDGAALTVEQIALLRKWIEQGATGPAGEQAEQDSRDHWSFRTPQRPSLPEVNHPAAARNAIDRFLLTRLDAERLAPRQSAAPAALLRRVYLDLIGLPPSPDELRQFLDDPSDEAYEQIVSRLLDSPLHGQRWARHWMDVWRYSDWYGRRHVPDVWNSAPQIWRWRDWIVDSLNTDVPYDRMVQAMLAADEIYPGDDRQAVATGFLIRNWFALNPNHWMRENVEHTAKAFLALTYNCAHCHDHKYDPIRQEDYFRLRAFFEPIGIRQDRLPGEADPGKFQEYEYSVLRKIQRLGKISVYDKSLDSPTWFYSGGDERNRVKERGPIEPGVPSVLGGPPLELQPLDLPPSAWYPGLQPDIQATELADRRAAIRAATDQWAKADVEVDAALPARRDALLAAERALADAIAAARDQAGMTALAGQQSLLLRAAAGRRVLAQSLADLKSLPRGTTLRFQIRILQDAHVNVQLSRDQAQGLTAAMLAFDKGRMVSYQVGGFAEQEIGKYDFSAGQNWFDVEWVFDSPADQGRLTVRDHRDGKPLADQALVALNGWNPVGDPNRGLLFDARTGCIAAFDEVAVFVPSATPDEPPQRVAHFDFEPPAFVEGGDVAGVSGWTASKYGAAPATSLVTGLLNVPGIEALREGLASARRGVEAVELQRTAARSNLDAANLQLESLERIIQADRLRYASPPDPLAQEAIAAAAASQRDAAVKAAEAAWMARRRDLAVVEMLPATDTNRATAMQAASPKVPEALAALEKVRGQAASADYVPLGATYGQKSSGRRRALAQWITSPQNPLTARVAANHIWMRHFGTPLVATVFDFGRNGAPPTHRELLDWLAVELTNSGWSMKHLHRTIVTSAAYRQSSDPRAAAEYAANSSGSTDPENRWLWHMNARRMEAEVVRDSLLNAADLLDRRPGGQELENSEALTTYRRSLYYSCHPEQGGKSELAVLFDAADAMDCYRRTTSIAPQQALALTNSDLVHTLGGQLASKLASENSPDDDFVTASFERVLARGPSAAERQLCLEFLERQTAIIRRSAENGAMDASRRARESLVRSLFNHNDFVTIR